MPTVPELSAQVDELQVALDAEQQQIADLLAEKATTIATLGEQVAALQAIVDAAPTPEQIQEVADKLSALKADLEGTV